MAKANYRYRYKPSATKLFKPAGTTQDTRKYIEGQVSNLSTRLEQSGLDPTQPQGNLDKRNIIEKALNLTPKQDVLMDILEVLDRPREVVSNVLSSLGDQDKRNVLEAAWDGLSGKEKLSTKEALQKLTGDKDFLQIKQDRDSNWDEIGNVALDIVLDIAGDPTTYLGFGVITKPLGAVAKGVGKVAGKVGGTALDIAKASKILKPAAEAVEGFVKGVAKNIDNAKYLFNATKGLTDDQVRAIKQISAEAGQTADELKLAIQDVADILRKANIKEGDKIAAEIIETGTDLVKQADGSWRVVIPDGKVVLDDIVKQFYDDIRKIKPGQETAGKVVEKFINVNLKKTKVPYSVANQLDTFVANLNKKAGKQIFALREANGSVALQFLGTADEFKAVLDDFADISGQVINFGQRQLSSETLEAIAKHGDTLKDATDKLRNIQNETRKFLNQMGEFDVGGKTFASNVEYLRRVPTSQADEFFKGQKYVVTDYLKPGTSDLASRTYEGTAGEINEALKNLYGATDDLFNESALLSVQDLVNVAQKQYTQTNLTKMFLGIEYDEVTKTYKKLENAPQFFISMQGKTTKEIAEQLPDGYKVIQDFKTEFSNLFKNLPKEMQDALNNDFLETLGAAGDSVAMQKSAYNIFKNADNAYKKVPELVEFYDKMLGTWKSVTLLSPGFHGRNFFGNATNMYLAGMNTADLVRYQSGAIKDLRRYKKLAKLKAEVGEQALKQSDRVFLNSFDEISRSGVLTGHRGARDLEDVKAMIDRLGQGKQFKDKNLFQKVLEGNFNLAEEMDDIQRIALYRWSLKKTGNSSAAFKQVREALFDYTLLTPFERDFAKRAIPFYTFMKNNLVFQSKNIINNPKQYAKLLRGYKHWTEGMMDMDINEMPEYMSGNMWLPIPTIIERDDKETINFIKLNLPPADFAELIQNPFNKGVSSLTVPAKIILELGTGRDTFTGAPLREFEGQKNRMEEGTGVLSGLRNEQGGFYLSGDPVLQKIADDLGFRNPRKLITGLLDITDVITNKKEPANIADALNDVIGMSEVKSLSEIELTSLYQQLEELRNLKKLYEQETGEKLPTLKQLEDRFGYIYRR